MGESKQRVYTLDALRGIAVIGMVIHHALVSFEIVFNVHLRFLYTNAFAAVQLVFVAVFLLISGICTNYSRSILKRGLIVFGAALVVSLATCVVLPAFGMSGLEIYFGILHMFGLAMIIYALFRERFEKINPIVGMLLFTAAFIAYYMFYATEPMSESPLLMIFGVLPYSIKSYGDYYPLFPYAFLFFAGTYVGKYVRDNKFPKWFYTLRLKPFELCGRYSLWVYVLHQPVIFGLLLLISFLIR